MPPGEWVVAERVRLAQEYLEKDDRTTLDDVAAIWGFGSQATMRHHFRRRTGTSPGAYRQRFTHGESQVRR